MKFSYCDIKSRSRHKTTRNLAYRVVEEREAALNFSVKIKVITP